MSNEPQTIEAWMSHGRIVKMETNYYECVVCGWVSNGHPGDECMNLCSSNVFLQLDGPEVLRRLREAPKCPTPN